MTTPGTTAVQAPEHSDAASGAHDGVAAQAIGLSKTYGDGPAKVTALDEAPSSSADRSRSTEATRRVGGSTCLVAVDGSVGSVRALVWGLRHAAGRGMCVEVLTVWPAHRSVFIHEVPGHFSAARCGARTAQQDAIRRALEEVSDRPITAVRLENADAEAAIVHASARCDLVVLGSNANDSSRSLTDRVLERADCEVVVVGSSSEVISTTGSVRPLTWRPTPTTAR